MSSDMKKSTLSGRLRLPMTADLLPAAGFGWVAFCAADGSAVASAAPAALAKKLRLLVVCFSRSLIVESPWQNCAPSLHRHGDAASVPRREDSWSRYCGATTPGVPPSLPGTMPSFGRCNPRDRGGWSAHTSVQLLPTLPTELTWIDAAADAVRGVRMPVNS